MTDISRSRNVSVSSLEVGSKSVEDSNIEIHGAVNKTLMMTNFEYYTSHNI